jgi:hypothetical protein
MWTQCGGRSCLSRGPPLVATAVSHVLAAAVSQVAHHAVAAAVCHMAHHVAAAAVKSGGTPFSGRSCQSVT